MNKYEMIAETSQGNVIREEWVEAKSEKEARTIFWEMLSSQAKNLTASIECVGVK